MFAQKEQSWEVKTITPLGATLLKTINLSKLLKLQYLWPFSSCRSHCPQMRYRCATDDAWATDDASFTTAVAAAGGRGWQVAALLSKPKLSKPKLPVGGKSRYIYPARQA